MDWGGKLVGDFKKRISNCKKNMKALRGSHDMRDILEYKQCCEDLNYVLHHQHVFWKQRAKKHWLKEGDVNSRIFHASTSARKQKNTIKHLKDETCNWNRTKKELHHIMASYFSNIFQAQGYEFDQVIATLQTKVTEEHNLMLNEPFTVEEIQTTIQAMHPDKSLGPDGMNLAFYQKF